MRCIFCKRNSTTSTSKEHIIPESLGNMLHTLPPGVVCDACNNYFAREVEKPFLESESVRSLRFEQALLSKRGRIPALSGIIKPIFAPAILTRHTSAPFRTSMFVPEDALSVMQKLPSGQLLFSAAPGNLSGKVVSRFLAKIAIEVMAARLLNLPEELEHLVDEIQLDPIRNHARRGDTPTWPYHARFIYDMNKKWTEKSGLDYQVVHEFDVLATEWGEWFLVVAIFGTEFAINYGGPEIDGYLRWLEEHDNASPLYSGKNAESSP